MIHGLTDDDDQLDSAGVLKKGDKKQGDRPGRPLPYFRFQGKGNPLQKRLIEARFNHHFPEPPTELIVWLVYPKASRNFAAWMEFYGSGNWLKIRCDKRQIILWYTGKYYSHEPRPCQFDPEQDKCPLGCGRVGRLSVWLPPLFRDGFYDPLTIETHSKNDIKQLTRRLRYFENLVGDVRGLPFLVAKAEDEIFRPGFDKAGNRTDKRGKMTTWLLDIQPGPWMGQRLTAISQQSLALPGQQPTAQLKSAEPPEEVSLVQETSAEVELGRLVEITGCPLKSIRAIVRSKFGCGLADLNDKQVRQVRGEIFLQWSEMQYGLSRQQSLPLYKEFWGEGRTEPSAELFQAWKGFVQQWAISAKIDLHF